MEQHLAQLALQELTVQQVLQSHSPVPKVSIATVLTHTLPSVQREHTVNPQVLLQQLNAQVVMQEKLAVRQGLLHRMDCVMLDITAVEAPGPLNRMNLFLSKLQLVVYAL